MITLLLIEDDLTLLDLLATSLELEGFQVHRAAEGKTGIALAKLHRPQLILCDVMMPGFDGYSVLVSLRADAQLAAIPFIFLTARDEKKDLRQGMVSGADDYLTKPIAMEDLLAAIHGRLARLAAITQRPADFSSYEPLVKLGLTPKQSEVLLWVAQGKTNAEVALILSITEATVKKHLEHIFEKLGVEKRGAASLIALEALVA